MNVLPPNPFEALHVRRTAKAMASKGSVRLAAGVCAASLIGLAVTGGVQGPTASGEPATLQEVQPVASTTTATNQNPMAVDVAKVVAITSTPDGTPKAKGLFTQTQATGDGSSTVTVPVGTSNPVDLNSFARLDTQNDSIIYSIQSSGTDVQQYSASGGEYSAEMPVSVDVDLKVNGESVDPNSATSFSGNVELTYNFINNTNSVEPITYKDSNGNVVTKEKNIAVPFGVTYAGTFDKGWSQIDAPWGDNGFSAGLTVTGTATMKPTAMNNNDPNAHLTVKAFTENASLPSASIKIQPQSTSGKSSVSSKVAQAGGKVDEALNKAIPLLTGIESSMGKASGKIAKILDAKINPILNLLSELKVNPDKAEALLIKGANDLTSGSNVFLGLNAAFYRYTAASAAEIAKATGPENQALIGKTIVALQAASKAINTAAAEIPKLSNILTKTAGFFAKDVGTTLGPLLCPGGASNCTWGQAIEGVSTDQLVSTCTTGQATNTALTPAVLASLNAVIAANPTKPWTPNLTTLRNLLVAQDGTAYPANCVATSQAVATQVDGLFSAIGTLATDLEELTPALTGLANDLQQVSNGLLILLGNMPGVHANTTEAAALLGPAAVANEKAEVLLDDGIMRLVDRINPLIDRLAQTANLIGDAALPLESRLNGLPGLIDELAYGTLGSFVGDAQNIAELSANLTTSANEGTATATATDAKFNTGVAFPYGVATGDYTNTNALYSFQLESAVAAENNTTATAIFALVLLAIAGASAVWLTRRFR